MLHQNPILPDFLIDLLVLSHELPLSMLAILLEPSNEFDPVRSSKCALAFHHVCSPLPFVLVTLTHEVLPNAVALACLPFADVQFAGIVEACPITLTKVVLPHALVLIVAAFLFVCAEENTLAVSFVLTVPLVS
jgi:hypothetical protein